MDTIVNRPGVTLLIAGLVSLVLRWPAGWLPVIGGLLSWILFLVAIFFIIGGIWMIFIGRDSSD